MCFVSGNYFIVKKTLDSTPICLILTDFWNPVSEIPMRRVVSAMVEGKAFLLGRLVKQWFDLFFRSGYVQEGLWPTIQCLLLSLLSFNSLTSHHQRMTWAMRSHLIMIGPLDSFRTFNSPHTDYHWVIYLLWSSRYPTDFKCMIRPRSNAAERLILESAEIVWIGMFFRWAQLFFK